MYITNTNLAYATRKKKKWWVEVEDQQYKMQSIFIDFLLVQYAVLKKAKIDLL